MLPRWFSCSGRRSVKLSFPVALRVSFLTPGTNIGAVVQRSCHSASKPAQTRRSELRNLLSLAEPEKYRLTGKGSVKTECG